MIELLEQDAKYYAEMARLSFERGEKRQGWELEALQFDYERRIEHIKRMQAEAKAERGLAC